MSTAPVVPRGGMGLPGQSEFTWAAHKTLDHGRPEAAPFPLK